MHTVDSGAEGGRFESVYSDYLKCLRNKLVADTGGTRLLSGTLAQLNGDTKEFVRELQESLKHLCLSIEANSTSRRCEVQNVADG